MRINVAHTVSVNDRFISLCALFHSMLHDPWLFFSGMAPVVQLANECELIGQIEGQRVSECKAPEFVVTRAQCSSPLAQLISTSYFRVLIGRLLL